MLIAGVGGQGVVYLTNLMVEAAMLADVAVATSEIHGLAQRSGSVIAAMTFGGNAYGFVETGGADFLLGLEPLEAQRCLPFLNPQSQVVIDDKRIFPYSVNAGTATYPDTAAFVAYLQKNIARVIFNQDFAAGLDAILRNVHLLGRASGLPGFPVQPQYIEQALSQSTKSSYSQQSLQAFQAGQANEKNN